MTLLPATRMVRRPHHQAVLSTNGTNAALLQAKYDLIDRLTGKTPQVTWPERLVSIPAELHTSEGTEHIELVTETGVVGPEGITWLVLHQVLPVTWPELHRYVVLDRPTGAEPVVTGVYEIGAWRPSGIELVNKILTAPDHF